MRASRKKRRKMARVVSTMTNAINAAALADLEVAKWPSPPVLVLQAGCADAVGFGFRSGSMAGDQVAKMVGAADSRARAPSSKADWPSASGTSPRLADERQIGVNLGWPRGVPPWQTGLRQHASHGAV